MQNSEVEATLVPVNTAYRKVVSCEFEYLISIDPNILLYIK